MPVALFDSVPCAFDGQSVHQTAKVYIWPKVYFRPKVYIRRHQLLEHARLKLARPRPISHSRQHTNTRLLPQSSAGTVSKQSARAQGRCV